MRDVKPNKKPSPTTVRFEEEVEQLLAAAERATGASRNALISAAVRENLPAVVAVLRRQQAAGVAEFERLSGGKAR